MIIGKLSRAHYSTGVTQEFLQNILARAQEASAKKATAAATAGGSKPWRTHEKRTMKTPKRDNLNPSNRGRQSQQSPNAVVTSRVKPTFNHSIVNKQPQFKRKGTTGLKSDAAEEDLINAFDSSKFSDRKHAKKATPLSNRRTSRSKDVPGMSRKPRRNRDDTLLSPPVKPRVSQEAYVPQEPTPLSLLKFYPPLPITPTSRMISYSLDLLKSADFPLYRRANYGFISNLNDRPKSVSYTLKSPYFGEYTPASSLIFQREKLFKNLTVQADPSKFNAVVLGEYPKLKASTKNDFASIAKVGKKKEELVANSNAVRCSLQGNMMDAESKELVYQVCSGLKPISELTQ